MRILINNEEIVCSNKITINEEMLNTSSTILNNCYPLSWETTKDYTQYYYPEDYSKCIIYGEPHQVQFTINGSLTQNGTPAPTNLVPMIPKTGTISENIGGTYYTFDLGQIQLYKLGNYEDYIYKKNGNWYRHQEIKGYIFIGQEDWEIVPSQEMTNTIYLSCSNLDYWIVNTFKNVKSDRFVAVNSLTYNDVEGIEITTEPRNLRLRISKSIATTVAQFKSWLQDNNVIIRYPIKNQLDELITDTNLINQLESVQTNLLFCGVAKRTGNINLNPRQFHGCDIQILDFKTFLSEGETLDYVINNQTVYEAIQQVVNTISDYGVILGNVDIDGDNDIIGAYSTANKTAYDVFNYIADITQSKWSTRLVDENTIAIDFYDPTKMPQGNDLEYTQQYFEDNEIIDIQYSYSTQDYRNKQIMLSNEVYADINSTEQIIADGYAKTFTVENNVFNIVSITVNGVVKTVANNEDKELGVTADFYYTAGKNTIEADEIYTAGYIIDIVYVPLVKGRQVIYNNNEVSRISTNTGRKGVIARYENRNDVLSSDELLAIGNTYIKYKGAAEITLTVQTTKNLWSVCEVVEASFFPINNLNTNYMVKSKQTEILTAASKTIYTYTLTSSFNSENAINYFDNQRNKAAGNIKSGEFIDRNIDIEESANIIFNNLTITEMPINGNNILNCALNSPFVE